MKKLGNDIRWILLSQFGIIIILAGLSVLGFLFHDSVLITYHRFGVRSAIKGMRRYTKPDELRSVDYKRQGEKLHRHRKALVDLGYLEERTFQPEYLTVNSPQMKKMLDEFRRIHPGGSSSVGWGSALTIIDRPEKIPAWESLIQKYDIPTSEPHQPDIQGDATEPNHF